MSSALIRPNVVVEPGKPRAKLLLLGDAPAIIRALPADVEIPTRPNSVVRTPGLGVCLWLRPEQRLLLLDGAMPAETAARIRSANAAEVWVLDAGARYVEFEVSGRDAGAVINTGCSLDLRPAVFPVDSCAQTRFDQVPVLLFRSSPERFEIFAERPLARHLWLWLCRALGDL
jgi:sarcosine oxidase, subunit gamma